MYLRQSNQKRADGSVLSHLQIAESVWDPVKKRSRVRIVYNCGRSDDPAAAERLRRLASSILRRCAPGELVDRDPSMRVADAWPYGDLYVLEQLWRRVGLPDLIAELADDRKVEFSIERALFAMVANRACAPSSKLYCHEQWLAEDVRIEGCEGLEVHHLYRAMDFLEAHKEALERGLYFRVADLLNLDVELVFYDTTSLHFETDDEDRVEGGDGESGDPPPAGGKVARGLRRRGNSKNGRGDAPQVIVGLAVTREGFPVRHWVFPGNTVDVLTVAKVRQDLKGWRLNRCVFVGDAGMVSADNLRALAAGGGRYIVCMPVHRGGEIEREVMGRRGRYRAVAENLQVKEVVVGDGERRRRYVVCFNPREAERQRTHRAQVLAELEEQLASLRSCSGGAHSKRACELRASGRYGKYLRTGGAGRLAIDRGKVRAARADGRQVRGVRQRRHAQRRGHGARLQAAATRGAGVASAQERAEASSGLPPRDPPDSRARGADGDRAAAGADGGARLRGDMASDPGRSEARSTCSIDWASRGAPAGYGAAPGGLQVAEILGD